jgi:hypothetical protein
LRRGSSTVRDDRDQSDGRNDPYDARPKWLVAVRKRPEHACNQRYNQRDRQEDAFAGVATITAQL